MPSKYVAVARPVNMLRGRVARFSCTLRIWPLGGYKVCDLVLVCAINSHVKKQKGLLTYMLLGHGSKCVLLQRLQVETKY